MHQSVLFNIVAVCNLGLSLFKNRLRRSCFPNSYLKFLTTTFLVLNKLWKIVAIWNVHHISIANLITNFSPRFLCFRNWKRVIWSSSSQKGITKSYVTCNFSTQIDIHPRLNSALPMVKALFLVTWWNELKFQRYGYFNPILTTRLKFQLGYNSACFCHVT